MEGYKHRWANYAVKNPTDPKSRLGTNSYRTYMERLKTLEPNVFGLLHHVAKYTGQLPDTTDMHNSLLHKILLTGTWAQVAGGAAVLVIVAYAVRRIRRNRREATMQARA